MRNIGSHVDFTSGRWETSSKTVGEPVSGVRLAAVAQLASVLAAGRPMAKAPEPKRPASCA